MGIAADGTKPVAEDTSVNDQVDGREAPETQVTPRLGFSVATRHDTEGVPVAIDPPWLQIVHPVGDLGMSGNFNPGSLVLGKEYLIAKANEHVRCVIWDYMSYFKEYLSVDQRKAGNTQARIFQTAAEAHAAGLTTERNPVTLALPTAPPAMTWVLLIEKPENVICDLFFVEVAGKRYAPAKFGVDKSAFLSVKNAFFMASQFTTKPHGGVRAMRWDLWTRIYEAKTGNKTWVPSIKPLGIIPEAERKAFTEAARLVGGEPQGEEAV